MSQVMAQVRRKLMARVGVSTGASVSDVLNQAIGKPIRLTDVLHEARGLQSGQVALQGAPADTRKEGLERSDVQVPVVNQVLQRLLLSHFPVTLCTMAFWIVR